MEREVILARKLGRIAILLMANGGSKRFGIISNEELKLGQFASDCIGFCLVP